jgi:hypothetical protein
MLAKGLLCAVKHVQQRPDVRACVCVCVCVRACVMKPKSFHNSLPSKVVEEGWWAVVGCKQTDELLALKRICIRRHTSSTGTKYLTVGTRISNA